MNGDVWRIRHSKSIGTEVERRPRRGDTMIKLMMTVNGSDLPRVRWCNLEYLEKEKPRYEGARGGRA